MERCFRSPEILSLICEQIPRSTAFRKRYLFNIARSCRAFLEPALDSLWYSIDDFKPIIACLPKDLLQSRTRNNERGAQFYVLSLQRTITPADLERYLSFYAPRIRVVEASHMRQMLSVDVWQGLQLVTRWQLGALAPLNTELSWHLNTASSWSITPDLLEQAFPYFSLFLGQGTTSLTFGVSSDRPIYMASVATALSGPAIVRKLTILDHPTSGQQGVSYIGQHLNPQTWTHIEHLDVSRVSYQAISDLALLPCLINLTIRDLLGVSALDYSEEETIRGRLSKLTGHAADSFALLQTLRLFSGSVEHFAGFLQFLPPGNRLHTLKCGLAENSRQVEAANRNLLATIRLHCNPQVLRKLVLKDETDMTEYEEQEELDEDACLGLRPIYTFTKLEKLHISLQQHVSLGPCEIDSIISAWPSLTILKINTRFPTSRLPSIDHLQLLKLLYNCRHLRKLGLRFNATTIRGDETVPTTARYNEPAPLTRLWVLDSPILAPSKVTKFLAQHCPKISTRWLDYLADDEVADHAPEFRPIYQTRWAAVSMGLRR